MIPFFKAIEAAFFLISKKLISGFQGKMSTGWAGNNGGYLLSILHSLRLQISLTCTSFSKWLSNSSLYLKQCFGEPHCRRPQRSRAARGVLCLPRRGAHAASRATGWRRPGGGLPVTAPCPRATELRACLRGSGLAVE